MKTKTILSIVTTVVLLSIISCTSTNNVTNNSFIQKRKYNNGFFVNIFNRNHPSNKILTQDFNSFKTESEEPELYTNSSNDLNDLKIDINQYKDIDLNFNFNEVKQRDQSTNNETIKSTTDSCSVIIMKDGDDIKAQVLEVKDDIIKYKKCGSINSPLYTINTDKIFIIRYPDGTKDVFDTGKDTTGKSEGTIMEGKSQIAALILVLLVGGIGIHRFYLGYPGIGLLQLFTLGLCGIWTLIDLIMILTGSLKPNGGRYEKTF